MNKFYTGMVICVRRYNNNSIHPKFLGNFISG